MRGSRPLARSNSRGVGVITAEQSTISVKNQCGRVPKKKDIVLISGMIEGFRTQDTKKKQYNRLNTDLQRWSRKTRGTHLDYAFEDQDLHRCL